MRLDVFVIGGLLAAIALSTSGLLMVTINIIMLIFAGLVFGVLMFNLSQFLADRTPLSYRVCYAALVLGILLTIGLGVYYLGTQAIEQADEFWSQLKSAFDQGQKKLGEHEWAKKYVPSVADLQKRLGESGPAMVPNLLNGLQSVAWASTAAFVIFFVGAYAAYEPGLYRTGMMKLFPLHQRDRILDVFDQLQSSLSRWLVSRFLSMSLVGVCTTIGLAIIGVPLAITLGVISAILTFIPNIGPLLAAVPQAVLAFNVSPMATVYVLILNVALQGIESYLITPLIQRREVAMPPILIIGAQLLFGVTIGIIGVMMAAPLMVVIMVCVQMLYIRDHLGDHHPGELTGGA